MAARFGLVTYYNLIYPELWLCVFFFGGADDGVGWGGMLTFMFMLRWWCYVDHVVGWGGVGWGGMMLTFMFMLRWWCYVDHGVWWGWMGWDVNVHVHVTLMMLRWSWGFCWGGVGCKRSCSCHADDVTLIMGWGGVGWDVNVHVHVTLKLFHGWSSFREVKKWACKAAYAVTLGSARNPP